MKKEVRLRALQQQIERLRRRQAELRQRSARLARLRLVVFLAVVSISGAAFYFAGPWLFVATLAAGLVLFGAAVACHRRIDRSLARHWAWLQLKLAQVARMQLDWDNLPGVAWLQPDHDHPFEADLDLVGERSLHRLVDTAVSYEGSQLLQAWLTNPEPDLAQITYRQKLVRELVSLSLFRGKLILNATLAANAQKMWDAGRVLAWLRQEPGTGSLHLWLVVFGGLAGLNLLLFGLNRLGWIPPLWQITFPLYFGPLLLVTARLTGETFGEAVELQEGLQQLSAVFKQLETFSYRRTPHLKALCAPFLQPGQQPSRYLAQATRLVAAAGVRGNLFLWLAINAVVPWDLYLAYRLKQVRKRLVRQAPEWLAAWFELEAVSSLANQAYLNPGYVLPGLSAGNGADSDVFQARGLGHPLLPDGKKVRNDFSITQVGDVAIITGSNMAGKSTFLRTVGINLALAYAGGPVDAGFFQARLFRLFSSMMVSDSVTDGISYFYAEVKRLKTLLSALESDHPLPLFFFIDEIFRGTNNRERFIGSQSYVQALVGQHGVGLISTHDLELARLAEQFSQVTNYHFRDDFAAGQMVFDYVLRPGPCPTTNALKIMQMEGLPVRPVADRGKFQVQKE